MITFVTMCCFQRHRSWPAPLPHLGLSRTPNWAAAQLHTHARHGARGGELLDSVLDVIQHGSGGCVVTDGAARHIAGADGAGSLAGRGGGSGGGNAGDGGARATSIADFFTWQWQRQSGWSGGSSGEGRETAAWPP